MYGICDINFTVNNAIITGNPSHEMRLSVCRTRAREYISSWNELIIGRIRERHNTYTCRPISRIIFQHGNHHKKDISVRPEKPNINFMKYNILYLCVVCVFFFHSFILAVVIVAVAGNRRKIINFICKNVRRKTKQGNVVKIVQYIKQWICFYKFAGVLADVLSFKCIWKHVGNDEWNVTEFPTNFASFSIFTFRFSFRKQMKWEMGDILSYIRWCFYEHPQKSSQPKGIPSLSTRSFCCCPLSFQIR